MVIPENNVGILDSPSVSMHLLNSLCLYFFILAKGFLVTNCRLEVLSLQLLSDFVISRSHSPAFERVPFVVQFPKVRESTSLVLHTVAEANVCDTKLGLIVLLYSGRWTGALVCSSLSEQRNEVVPQHGLQQEVVSPELTVARQVFDLDCVVIHLNGAILELLNEPVLLDLENLDVNQNHCYHHKVQNHHEEAQVFFCHHTPRDRVGHRF